MTKPGPGRMVRRQPGYGSRAYVGEFASMPTSQPYATTICMSVDYDAVSTWIAAGQTGLRTLSRGEFAAYATPQLLEIFKRYAITTSWYIPGTTALQYPDSVAQVAAADHEIANHTLRHEDIGTLSIDHMRHSRMPHMVDREGADILMTQRVVGDLMVCGSDLGNRVGVLKSRCARDVPRSCDRIPLEDIEELRRGVCGELSAGQGPQTCLPSRDPGADRVI